MYKEQHGQDHPADPYSARVGAFSLDAGLLNLIGLSRYQASVRVLQAGQFGVPQARERVIFLGAKLGLPMPVHPVPTHAFPKVPNTANLADGTTLVPLSRAPNGEKGYIYAPLPPVTIEDAIGDLVSASYLHGVEY